MIEPNEEQLRLAEGVGTWLGEEPMLPSAHLPEGRTATAWSEARMCAGGRIPVSEVSSDGETWTRIFEGTYSREGS